MATILGKLFGAIKSAVNGNKATYSEKSRSKVDSVMRKTEKPAIKHAATAYGRANTKGAFGSSSRNKQARKMIRRYGYYNVMVTQPAVREKMANAMMTRKALDAIK